MIYLITIQPIMIFLLMSFLLPYTTMHNVVISNDSGSETAIRIVKDLQTLEGIKVQETSEDKITEKLSGGNAELGIVIKDIQESDVSSVSFIVIGESEIESAVELCVTESLKTGTDLLGMSIVYLIFMMLGSVIYCFGFLNTFCRLTFFCPAQTKPRQRKFTVGIARDLYPRDSYSKFTLPAQ